MRWTRKAIVAEIKRLHAEGAELNYATAENNHLNLVRAAAWHFGTWRRAVESAGIEYESISKYQRWNRERIVARIRELHSEGADLNWRAVSTEIDPPLAAAALRTNGFQSWRDAIRASGLDINGVARYQAWDEERIIKDIKALHRAGLPLSSKAVQLRNQPLFCAARRRFGSWDEALAAAGLSVQDIRLRQPSGAAVVEAQQSNASRNGMAPERTPRDRAPRNEPAPGKKAATVTTSGAAKSGATRNGAAKGIAAKGSTTAKTKAPQPSQRPVQIAKGGTKAPRVAAPGVSKNSVATQMATRPPSSGKSATKTTRSTQAGRNSKSQVAVKSGAVKGVAVKGAAVRGTISKGSASKAGAAKKVAAKAGAAKKVAAKAGASKSSTSKGTATKGTAVKATGRRR
ncbi:MAG TPA: hypothetical protein VF600_03255 [Abditibacteriaceae bacterium]